MQSFTNLNSFLLGPDDFWVISHCTENPACYALTLTTGEHGRTISSEALAELAGDRTPIPSGTAAHIDRRTGTIEAHSLG